MLVAVQAPVVLKASMVKVTVRPDVAVAAAV